VSGGCGSEEDDGFHVVWLPFFVCAIRPDSR
jgi:hypothetical protein